nr:hypothetical protein [Rhizobium sp. G21]
MPGAERFADLAADPFCGRHDFVGVRRPMREDAEHVSGDPERDQVVAGDLVEPVGDGLEHEIPEHMAEGIVDRLEIVETDQKQRRLRIRRPSLIVAIFLLGAEQIRQPGQGVVIGKPVDLVFRRFRLSILAVVARPAANACRLPA